MMLADSQRRLLLRILFLTLGLLPCLGLLAWAATLRTAGHRAAWERGFSTLLGMRVQMEDVRYLRPGIVLLEKFRGYDPETDAVVFTCRSLEAEEFADGRHLRAQQAEIFADRGARLFAALERRLRRELPEMESAVTFHADELTWHIAGESQTLVAVDALAGPAENAQQLLINFALPDTAPEHPVSLRITRAAEADPTTSVELDTGAVVLPCVMFAPMVDAISALGPRAQFTGRLKLRRTADGWDGVVTGDVAEADLDALISRRFPHTLSGSAELRVHRAELARGRLERLQLTVLAGPGQISRSLVAAADEHLHFGDAASLANQPPMLLFDRLAFDATWDEGAFVIKARNNGPTGVLLSCEDVAYWREPIVGPQSAASLLRTLLPMSDLLIPAAGQAGNLMQWLPLLKSNKSAPAATPSGGVPATATRVHVRGIGEPR